MSPVGFSVMLAGIDSLMKKKLQLYSGKNPGVQLFFINSWKDYGSADMLVIPGCDLRWIVEFRLADLPPLICYGVPEDMGVCLAAGCIDYLCSPWGADEFFERVRRGVERSIERGVRKLEDCRLSNDEQKILRLFLRNRGVFFSRRELSEFLGSPALEDSRKIDMLISRLRKKMSGSHPGDSLICTSSGSGWGIGRTCP